MSNKDPRFQKAINLFNDAEWYQAHDVLEEIWHEMNEPERQSIQGLLQITVAELHLERGNINGAIILFGEGIGRIRSRKSPDMGLNLDELCIFAEAKLRSLQNGIDKDGLDPPLLKKIK